MVQERDTRLFQIEDMIRRLFRRKADVHLINALAKVHPAEAAQIFRNLETEERQGAFAVIADDEQRAEILAECDDHIVSELLEPMPNAGIVSLLKEIGSDDARHIIEALPEERAGQVVEQMDVHESFAIEDIMAYAPDSAGSIMSDSFAAFYEETTVEEVIGDVRKASEVDYVFYGHL